MVELDEIKKLPPKERIAKLKEIEEQKKREMEEAKKLIQLSEIESEEEERLEEQKELIYENEGRKQPTLEEEVKNAKVEPNGKDYHEYISQLSQKPAYQLYNDMQNIVGEGGLSDEQLRSLSSIQYALEEKKRDIERGEYSTSDKVVMTISSTQKILEEIMGAYKR